MNNGLTAVILAAGMGTRLREVVGEQPKGLLRLGTSELIIRSLEILRHFGIEKIVMVTGYKEEDYQKSLAEKNIQVEFVTNHDYASTGSMHSLSLAEELVDSDILLLESDLFYEQLAIQTLIEQPGSAILLSGQTNSGDEVYVYGNQGKIDYISKEKKTEFTKQGELVGISRI